MNQTSRSIVEALARHAERSPERCCIRWNGAEITYGRLMEQTRRLARGLRALGIGAGERVALVMDNAPDYIASYLAIQLAGGVAVLVNPQYRAAELLHILNDAEPRLALVDQPHRALLEQTRPAAAAWSGSSSRPSYLYPAHQNCRCRSPTAKRWPCWPIPRAPPGAAKEQCCSIATSARTRRR